MKKINIINLGCSKNLVDSEIVKGGLIGNNFQYVDDVEKAETVIINTCGFILSARKESIDMILEIAKMKQENKLEKLIVMGCLSERFEDELRKEIPEVDKYFGANKMSEVIKYLSSNRQKYDPIYSRSLMTKPHYAFLKISEGCSNKCSFCSIPIMRGKQGSRPLDEIIEEANYLVREKHIKELIVIAQDTTTYGYDLKDNVRLFDVLKELDRISKVKWIRLHYAHPDHFDKRIIDLISKAKRIIPYLDIPFQHVNEEILRKMNRQGNRETFTKLIREMRNKISKLILRTTFMVGFPGETEEQFLELYDFIKEVKFERLGVFKYSEEQDTFAEKYDDNIPEKVKEERYNKIMELQQKISLEFNKKLVGSTQTVLIDEYDKNSKVAYGRTYMDSPEIDNNVIIEKELNEGEFYNIKINDFMEYDLFGEKNSKIK